MHTWYVSSHSQHFWIKLNFLFLCETLKKAFVEFLWIKKFI